MKAKKVILNYPPASSVWHLPAGISLLTSVLRERGHEVVQRYGHIAGLEYVLRNQDPQKTEEALEIVRDPTNSIEDWYRARKLFEQVSTSIETSDRFGVERNNVIYVSSHYDGSINGLLRAIDERDQSMWFDYFDKVEVPLAQKVGPDLYGISIADERQLIQGMTLASMIKEALPKTRVVIGGNFWSRVTPAFKEEAFRKVFDYCDAIVYREGFQPIVSLAETLDPRQTPSTAWRDSAREVIVNPKSDQPTSFESLPTPSFEGGARQWCADTVPQLYTCSNCPMQCGFCAIAAGSDTYLKTPRIVSPERVAKIMEETGAKRFEIADENFIANRQLAIGKALKERGYDATWNCYLTITDDLLNPDKCNALYEAGCRGVQLGLESLSRATLLREFKSWNHPESYARILSNLADAGIHNHVFLLTGLPGEEVEAGLRWLPFLKDHGDSILTIKAGRYRLTKGSPEELHGTHSERIIPENDDRPLHLNRNFKYRDSRSSRKRVEAVRDLIEQSCREHWAYAVTSAVPWWANRGRYNLEELRSNAYKLPKDPDTPHLNEAIAKARGILGEATGKKYSFARFEELVEAAREV